MFYSRGGGSCVHKDFWPHGGQWLSSCCASVRSVSQLDELIGAYVCVCVCMPVCIYVYLCVCVCRRRERDKQVVLCIFRERGTAMRCMYVDMCVHLYIWVSFLVGSADGRLCVFEFNFHMYAYIYMHIHIHIHIFSHPRNDILRPSAHVSRMFICCQKGFQRGPSKFWL